MIQTNYIGLHISNTHNVHVNNKDTTKKSEHGYPIS